MGITMVEVNGKFSSLFGRLFSLKVSQFLLHTALIQQTWMREEDCIVGAERRQQVFEAL